MPQFGLVAEEVARIAPQLVVSDAEGKPFTVRYEEVNAMLLNEFLKEHGKVERLEAALTRLESALEKQSTELKPMKEQLSAIPVAVRLVTNE